MTSSCEICGKSGSESGYRYSRLGTRLAQEISHQMKHCFLCKRLGCDGCLVMVEETADDHFIAIYSCSRCLQELHR